jgi:hypothetical protein
MPTYSITPARLAVLQHLGTYGFLSMAHLQRLTGRTKAALGDDVRALAGHKLINRREVPLIGPGGGRPPHEHSLTERGAAFLSDLIGEPIRVLAGGRGGTGHLLVPHRWAVVDTHIALRHWARANGHAIERYVMDHDASERRDMGATGVALDERRRYEPDSVAVLAGPDGVRRMFVVEVHRGGIYGDLSSFRRKLDLISEVIEKRVLPPAYGLVGPAVSRPRFLLVFLDPAMLDGARRAFKDPESPKWQGCFLKALPLDSMTFDQNWIRPWGSLEQLLPNNAGK